jgi:hypothetical protein
MERLHFKLSINFLFRSLPVSVEVKLETRFMEAPADEDEDNDEDEGDDEEVHASSWELNAGEGGKEAASIR